MKLTLNRTTRSDTATIGNLFVDDVFECHTLEDTIRELGPNGEGKVWGATAIPAGTYSVIVNGSARFKRLMPRLLDVPFFDGILIHTGNTPENTHGCILVGDRITGPASLALSTPAFNRLFPKIVSALQAGDTVTITISNPPA